jgi:hypothetical protein
VIFENSEYEEHQIDPNIVRTRVLKNSNFGLMRLDDHFVPRFLDSAAISKIIINFY